MDRKDLRQKILWIGIIIGTIGLAMGIIGAFSESNPIANIGALVFLGGTLTGVQEILFDRPEKKPEWNAKEEVKRYLEKDHA